MRRPEGETNQARGEVDQTTGQTNEKGGDSKNKDGPNHTTGDLNQTKDEPNQTIGKPKEGRQTNMTVSKVPFNQKHKYYVPCWVSVMDNLSYFSLLKVLLISQLANSLLQESLAAIL